MSINQRIKIIVDSYERGIGARFADKIGISPTVVVNYLPEDKKGNPRSRVSEPGFEILNKILQAYPQLSSEWLITGSGPMEKNSTNEPPAPATVNTNTATGGKAVNKTAGMLTDNTEILNFYRKELDEAKAELRECRQELKEQRNQYLELLTRNQKI